MKKIAFLLPPYFGHVQPTIPIGTEFMTKGYEVHWICPLRKLETMIPKKGHFHCITLPYEFNPEVYEMTGKTTKYGLDSIYTLYEHSLVPLNKILFPQFLKKLKEIRPHYVIVDQQAFSGAAACNILNIPFATSVTAPAAIERSKYFPKVMEFENAQIVKFQQEVGIARASACLLYTSPSPRDKRQSRMPSSA